MRTTLPAALTVGAALGAGLAAHAAPPKPAAPAPSGAPLSGPSVERDRAEASLVRRAFDGALIRLERRPEEAALDLLALDEKARAAVRTIQVERSAAFDRLFREDLDTILQLGPAFESGEVLRALGLLKQLHQKFVSIAGQTPLVDRVAGALPGEIAERYRALVDEYMDALVEDELAKKKETPARGLGGRIQSGLTRAGLGIQLFGKEIEAAAHRTFRGANDDGKFEAMLNALELTPEQRKEIYAIAVGFAQNSGMGMMEGAEPDKEQLAGLLLEIYDTLEPEQQRKLFELVIRSQ